MDEALARMNVARFRELLAAEPDEVKRGTLHRLLDEEVAKLRALHPREPGNRKPSRRQPSNDSTDPYQRLPEAPPSPQQ